MTLSLLATTLMVTEVFAYDLGRRIATTTTEVDPLGRVVASRINTGSSPIEQRFAYDLAGNRVYSTDLFVASATAYDSNGRAIATRAPDGTITTVQHDETGQPTEVKALDPSATKTVSEANYTFSTAGRLQSMKARVDASTDRSTSMVWDGGGRTTGIAVAFAKAPEEMTKLLSWMSRNPEMSSDRTVAEQVYRDLKQAFSTPDVRTGK